LYALPDAVRLMPLVEELQAGVALTPEDVRPYRKPIKHLSLGVTAADKLAAGAGALAVGIPLRRALNRKIEQEFPGRAAEAIAAAREGLANIETEVDFVAGFENPREQFLTEVNDLAQTATAAILKERDQRVANRLPSGGEAAIPRGVAGFMTRVSRAVRHFFGVFRRPAPPANTAVTAYDAGAGLERVFSSLGEHADSVTQRLPLLSKLVFNKLPAGLAVTKDRLALVAPEILTFLYSTAPDNKQADELVYSVNRYPHELRFVTHFKRRYGHYSLDTIQRAAQTLLPAIRDILPTTGREVREVYDRVQSFLSHQPTIANRPAQTPSTPKKLPLRSRFKQLFTRSSKKTAHDSAHELMASKSGRRT
jgi:hypothetical protein